MENSVDPAHLQILHQDAEGRQRRPADTTRGFTEDVEAFDFYEVPYGIMKKRTYKVGFVDQHPLIFPNVLRLANYTQIRVPLDDTHTDVYYVHYEEGNEAERPTEPLVEYVEPFKNPAGALHPLTRFKLDRVDAQDYMAWETQGPIADRTKERLATSDRGIVMLRELMRREIEKVQRGLDPIGVIRDPARNTEIDTGLAVFLQKMRQQRLDTEKSGAEKWSADTHP
jgi:5,5'-dehydrodivanillate O-demethylase